MSSEWRLIKLGSLVDIKHGFAFKGEFFSDVKTHLHLTTPGNFAIGGGFQSEKTKYYNGPVPSDFVLNADDLLVTMTDLSKAADTLGYAAKLPATTGVTWLHNQRVGLVGLKSGVPATKDFLHYLMRSPEYRHWVVSTATGSTVKHTSPSRICDYEFLLPPLDAQADMALTLGALDDRITLLRETNATLEAIAQALFKSWFVDFDPVRAKMEGRAPEGMDEATAALFPDSFEETELGEVPRGWRIAKFEDFILRISVGKKFDQKSAKLHGRVPILDQGKSGVIGYHDEDPGVRASLEEPVVVFANHTCYMRLIPYDFSAIQNVLPFRGKGIDTVWAYYATHGRVKFSEYKGHWPDFAIEKAVIPNKLLGEAFRTVVDPIIRKLRANELQVEMLLELRDALLPRLISGQLRLTENAYESVVN